ncbi:hypothetical protein ABVG11_34395 [Streptomyces sp. HD1123-B1]|uniref:hypothetical protein n=1 Tax=Streptomyces huangiella TaxID=3228804 RepID=UPI003D7C8C36
MAANPPTAPATATLLDLCAQALSDGQRRDHAEWSNAQADAVAEAVKWAPEYFGEAAAAELDGWMPLDVMLDSTLQAHATVAPGAYLVFTLNLEDGRARYDLMTSCSMCHHHREVQVGSLEQLAEGLRTAGVLR